MGVVEEENLADALVRAAEDRVQGWFDALNFVPETLDDVHELVLNQTGLHIESVATDDDLLRVGAAYRNDLATLPTQLELEFGERTEALVFRRAATHKASASRYVAVVDARGDRSPRAWFAQRHESAHLLIDDPGAQVLVRRTRADRPEPLEKVVDAVAARVGFWEPIVRPILSATLARQPRLLDAFDEARLLLAPEASIEASYRAFCRLIPSPVVILWCDFGGRQEERHAGRFAESWALRAKVVIFNDAAERHRMKVWPNFRIPPRSVIARAQEGCGGTMTERDNLGTWSSESGRTLAPIDVVVTARGAWASIQAA